MSGSGAPVSRSSPGPHADYHEYREVLRHDFWYSCAYCTIAESEAQAIGFQIDHYLPRSVRPDLTAAYENLNWSCEPCNHQKGDYPFTAGPIRPDCYILRPDHEHPAVHYRLEGVELQPLTSTGDFNIEWLFLNRQALKILRKERARLWKSLEICAHGLQHLRSISIDRLPKESRAKFIRLYREISQNYKSLVKGLEDYIRERTRSPLLDPDPKHRAHLKRRRTFLRDEKVIGPGCTDALPKPPSK